MWVIYSIQFNPLNPSDDQIEILNARQTGSRIASGEEEEEEEESGEGLLTLLHC